MLITRAYYRCKPFVPPALRLIVKRARAKRILKKYRDVWPIKESAGRKPCGWPGWPDSKEFAFVLTHDVESQRGYDHVQQLAELEMDLGFRSSFNLIPEGPYQVSQSIRDWLVENGFEVGVHDLRHDGRLYGSHNAFQEKAARINDYLKKWNAVGFRSAFMLRRLSWLHRLNLLYDTSTFDTDPFEPQPEGVNTIFPFWIPENETCCSGERSDLGKGYFELPYTLPQDSTVFLQLNDQNAEIWKTKLAWIAKHQGMALLNVHPDYFNFPNEKPSKYAVCVDRYLEFLQHVRNRYEGRYWQALPREVAEYAYQIAPRSAVRRPRRICMVSHSFYESDNRVMRYAETLAERGDSVEILALRRAPGLPSREIINGVELFRIQDRFGKQEKSKLEHFWPIIRFLRASSRWISRNHKHFAYDLLHIHNMPDFLVFAGWYPKLTSAKIILDIHDILPELYVSKFGKSEKTVTFNVLKGIERISAMMANHIIISNHLWLPAYSRRTKTQDRCSVFINNVDANLFTPGLRNRYQDDKWIVLFPGGLQWHQGLDVAIRAFRNVRDTFANAEFHIYGDGIAKESLVRMVTEMDLENAVRFFTPVGIQEIATVMANADVGIVPKRADSFGNEAYSTKIMEFMAVGVPVVVSDTKIDRYYFDDSVVRFFKSGDDRALADEIIKLLRQPKRRRDMVERALRYAAANAWNCCKSDYLALVDSLCWEERNGKSLRRTDR